MTALILTLLILGSGLLGRSWADEEEPAPGEGDPVVVDRVQGLTLSVRRAEVWQVEP